MANSKYQHYETFQSYPYMHDGNIKTLEEVIDHYIKGGEKNPNKDERINL